MKPLRRQLLLDVGIYKSCELAAARVSSTNLTVKNLLDIEQTAFSSPDGSGCPVLLDGVLCHVQIVRVARTDQVAQPVQTSIDVPHGAR